MQVRAYQTCSRSRFQVRSDLGEVSMISCPTRTNSDKVNTSDLDSKYYIGADKVFDFLPIAKSYRHLHNPLNKVGDGFADHGYWGRPEEMNMARPTFTLNTNN